MNLLEILMGEFQNNISILWAENVTLGADISGGLYSHSGNKKTYLKNLTFNIFMIILP